VIMRGWYRLVLALCALSSCKNDLDELARVDVHAGAPDRTTTDAEYLYSDSGIVRNRLHANKVEDFMAAPGRRTVLTDGMELVFLDAQGNDGSVLTARQGLILPTSNRMEVRGNVVFTNARGERLETELLVWNKDSARVWTDRPVKIIREHDILYGDGLDANENFSRYTIRKLTGTLYVDQADSLAGP